MAIPESWMLKKIFLGTAALSEREGILRDRESGIGSGGEEMGDGEAVVESGAGPSKASSHDWQRHIAFFSIHFVSDDWHSGQFRFM